LERTGTFSVGTALTSNCGGSRSSVTRIVALPSIASRTSRCRGDVAFKGGLKRPQCDGIAIGCARPKLQFFPDILGQLLFGMWA
jgi:hypothetical protein